MEISIPPISINPEYENAARPLTKDEYSSLVDSIKEHGLRDPIVTNEKGIILDGHNRFRACQELGIKLQPDDFFVKQFDNLYEEQIYVYEVNLLRRQLNPAQRVAQVLKTKEIYQKLAKLNMSKGGSGIQIRTPLERVNKHLATRADVKPTKFFHIEYGLNNGSEDQRRKLLSGVIKPNKLYGDLMEESKMKKLADLNKVLNKKFDKAIDKIDLRVGDFKAECSKIKRDSISLIYTDPLYDEAHIYLYDGVGKVSMELLQSGGSLITYINQSQLFVIGDKLLKAGLTFWWPLCIKLENRTGHSVIFDRHTEVDYKILLWFVKGPRPINPSFPKSRKDGKRSYLGDLMIISEQPDKRYHNFAQSHKDAEYVMKYLTAPNDWVLDLFLGGGSTAVAAMNTKRRFIGIDIDPKAIEKTNVNLRMNYEINSQNSDNEKV